EKTVQVLPRSSGNHAVRDVEIGEAVMIEVECVARPRPAPQPNSRGSGPIVKSSAATSRRPIAKQRIAHRVFPVERPHFLRCVFLEHFLRRNALTSSSPHVSDIEVLGTVIVVIEPANAHARANVLHSCLGSNIGKSP